MYTAGSLEAVVSELGVLLTTMCVFWCVIQLVLPFHILMLPDSLISTTLALLATTWQFFTDTSSCQEHIHIEKTTLYPLPFVNYMKGSENTSVFPSIGSSSYKGMLVSPTAMTWTVSTK